MDDINNIVNNNIKILAVIPARSGSKGIKFKNIKNFNEHPLIYWSIKQAKESKFINRVIVSTDSIKFAELSKQLGAEVPFLRPANISGDLSTDLEFMDHCLKWLKDNNNYCPDIIVQLRPTYPTRSVKKIDDMISLFISKLTEYDCLRTVAPLKKSPYKMYRIINDTLIPLFDTVDGIDEPYNQCRQLLPQCFIHNGYVDIMKPSVILKKHSISGKILPYVMTSDDVCDIDTEEDWILSTSINAETDTHT
jgi:CMP-N-acetylneuraminic acid synthetase